MLKATLSVKENVDLDKFPKVKAFLKRNAVGYEPKKSAVLSRDDLNRFISDADDEKYLMLKVAFLFGICGACRREELHNMKISDIVDNGSMLIINVPDTKTKKKRVFTVTPEGDGFNPLQLFRKYSDLRPASVSHDYFFIGYRSGKCTVQRVGVNTFGKMPAVIADFLNLPHPESFTGHCFRRTSATLVADAGADLVMLKRHGGWRSSAVAEGYIEDSIEQKMKVAKLILRENAVAPSTSASVNSNIQGMPTGPRIDERVSFCGNSFQNAQNCVFNIQLRD